jgi:hypothetical protein
MTNDPKGTAVDARIGRREFVAGAIAAAIVVPLALRAAAAESLASAVRAAIAGPAPLADWHIDDQWGPRYAEPIAFAAPRDGFFAAAAVDPIDAPFVA